MKIQKLKLLLLIFALITQANAQNSIVINGMLKSDSTHAQVPFASIGVISSDIATIADAEGFFKLTVDKKSLNDSIKISAIGYSTLYIPIKNFKSEDTLQITLIDNIYRLPVGEVIGLKAQEVVRKAIAAIQKNYLDTNFVCPATFIQYHRENDKYVRLIYADLNVLEQPKYENKIFQTTSLVNVTAVLKSKNKELNNEQHGDHLMDVLNDNPVLHPLGSVLNIKAITFYRFTYDTIYNSNQFYKIIYVSLDNTKQNSERGYLLIEKSSFAIYQIEKYEVFNPFTSKDLQYSSTLPYTWVFVSGKTQLNYRLVEGKMITESIFKTYTNNLIDNKVKSKAYKVDEYFELYFNNPIKQINPEENFTDLGNLYTRRFHYNEKLNRKFSLQQFYFIDKNELLKDLDEWDARP